MFLVAVGRVSCWIMKHLLVPFSKICNACRRAYFITGLKAHLTSKSLCPAKPGGFCSRGQPSQTLNLSRLFCCPYVKSRTGPLQFTNKWPPSPASIKSPQEPNGKNKRERMRPWAVSQTFCLLPFSSSEWFSGPWQMVSTHSYNLMYVGLQAASRQKHEVGFNVFSLCMSY